MSCTALRLLLLLSLAASPLTGCGGCSDDVEPEEPGPAPADMSADADPADDMERPDAPPDDMAVDMRPDMKMDPPDLPEFDFGVPDMPAAPFALIDVVPPSGPVAGGTRVRVRGTSIPQGAQVFFGAQPLESLVYEASGVVGRTPPGSGPGPVSVKVIAPDGQLRTLEGAYTYIAPLRIDAVTPSRIPTTGGVEVEVRGQGFASAGQGAGVTFSGTPALRVELLSDGLLRVVSPPRPAGAADVRVITAAGAATAPAAVTYFTPLAITAVDPASGLTAGGEEVVVRGEGFASGMEVRFGGQRAEVVQVNAPAGEARVRTPAHPVGLVDVAATSAGESALLQRAFYYRADASALLAAVSPAQGSTDGGELVRLIGVGLDRAGARFTFGGQPATIVSQSATSAIVRTPAAPAGAVAVAFFDGAQPITSLPDAYTYIEALAIEAVNPASGPVTGGQEVTITGRGLAGASRVAFGGLPAQIIESLPGALRVRTPAHAEGPVNVSVERGGLTATKSGAYSYEGPLVIWGFTPVRGAVAGNTYVEVRGQGFAGQGTLEVTLGGRAGAQVRRLDPHTLSFLTPPGPAGEAALSVSLGGRSAAAPYPYQYFEPAARFGGASGGNVDGAINVTVYSTGGAPIPDAFVMLSTRPDTRYQGFTNPAGQLTLSGPDVLGEQTVSATAAGYSTAVVQSVDAENVTIFLNQLDPTPSGGGGGGAPPPSAIIQGRVSTPGKLANPDDQLTYDMAIVRTTSPSPAGGNPNPGPGSVVLGDGDYVINTRVGDLAIVAICGVYNERTQNFDPQYMGVARYLQVSDQQVLNVDVACNIPLDQTLPVKLVNPVYNPEGPNTNAVNVVWSFGFEGYFASPGNGRSLASLIPVNRQPALTGELADVTLLISGGSFTGDFAPLTQSGVNNITSTSQLVQLPPLLDVPELISPVDGGMISNGEIRWQVGGAYRPDLISIVMRDARGIPVWSMVLPGDATSARIPDFPDLSSLPPERRPQPYPQDVVYLTISSARIPGATFDSFTYQDLDTGRWEAYSLNRWTVSFPPR